MIFWIFFSYFVSHSWGIPMMKITGLSHLFKWENLHNWWLTKYFFAPLYIWRERERKRGGIFCYWFNWKNWLNNAFKESLKILSAPKQVKESCFKGQNRHHSGTNQQSQVERYKIMLAKANWIINAILIMTITTDASTEQLVGLLRCSFHWSSKIQSSLGFIGFVVLANTELPVNLLTQWTPLQTCLTGKMQAALSGHISFRLSIHSFLHEM